MNSPLESGLFLPVRFYKTLAEQDMYKRISAGVALIDEVYIYADCKTLIPFQIILNNYCEEGINGIFLELVCIDGDEILLTASDQDFEYWNDTVNQLSYYSYLGNADFTGQIGNGKYYIRLTVVDMCEYTNIYYSDYFVIRNCETSYDIAEYRITSQNQSDKRLVDLTDLRITKT